MATYQTMPPLADEEFQQLRDSIKADGIKVPVILDDEGNIIDGHHRVMIAEELGIDYPRRTEFGLSETQKVAMSITLNVARRNLNREQRRVLIAKALQAQPERSDNSHAQTLGVSDKTVTSVRREMEQRSEIPNVTERTDSLGRQQPATKPVKVTETVKTETFVDAGTGEVVEELPTVATTTGTVIAEQRKVTIGLDGKEYKRPEPKPAKQIDWEQKNADQMANALAASLNTLNTLQDERKRQIFINEWIPRGQDAVPPDPRKLFNPGAIRAIASYLITFANELESNNEH